MLKEGMRLRRQRTVERYRLDTKQVGDHCWIVKGDLMLFDGERLQAFCCPDCGQYLIRLVMDDGSRHMGPDLVCPADTKVLDALDDSVANEGEVNAQRSPLHRERKEMVAAEVGKLTNHLERVGLESAKARVGQVLEATMQVARLHPDESVRTEFGAALLGLWSAVSMCQGMLTKMADDGTDVVH
ncbi:MAG: hypothetical protein OXF54_14515 [Caldilineaceae bacterium]|nr:hypothetical protein [Caldilineaceae bacterium]